jgi:hypothetical protein
MLTVLTVLTMLTVLTTHIAGARRGGPDVQ